MSIYTCPHCGEKSFNPWTKAMAGQLNSKGKPCMKCGKRCVNGKGATIFNMIYSILVLAGVVLTYLYAPDIEWLSYWELVINIGLILSLFVVPKLVNAFCFKMAPAIRLDVK